MRSREIENEVQQARQKTHEITKNMTSKERVAYMNARGEELAKTYGFKIAPAMEVSHVGFAVEAAAV